jgi:virulence factor Mce-like protein
MRRVLTVMLAVAGAAAFAFTTGAKEEGSGQRYTLELDNAFGLVEGADVKIAGVRAGKIAAMRVDKRSKRALIDLDITKLGFGDLRADVFCETRPQSLIGEYFVDCQPGTSARKLPVNSTIPVERTGSTVPVDLVNNVLRRPEKERLRIILGELGAGVGGRAEDLNEAVRRASPALRETEQVLGILGRQNLVLRDLVVNADRVIGDMAGNRKDIVRWAKETKETAAASAERRDDIEAGFKRLPGFLRELRPTMAELGRVAAAQEPSLRDLNASAGELEDFFQNLGPFSEASRVNIRSLAKASGPGRRAAKASQATVAELSRFAEPAPELSKNLRIVLAHLDDRQNAVEPDPRSPGGKGYTGLEALLRYVYTQGQAINVFDRNGYILKVNLFEGECSEYHNPESLKKHLAEDPDYYKRCAATLGPNQPGITTADSTAPKGSRQNPERRMLERRTRNDERPAAERVAEQERNAPDEEDKGSEQPAVDLRETLDELLPDAPALPEPVQLPQASTSKDVALLDYLFGR